MVHYLIILLHVFRDIIPIQNGATILFCYHTTQKAFFATCWLPSHLFLKQLVIVTTWLLIIKQTFDNLHHRKNYLTFTRMDVFRNWRLIWVPWNRIPKLNASFLIWLDIPIQLEFLNRPLTIRKVYSRKQLPGSTQYTSIWLWCFKFPSDLIVIFHVYLHTSDRQLEEVRVSLLNILPVRNGWRIPQTSNRCVTTANKYE